VLSLSSTHRHVLLVYCLLFTDPPPHVIYTLSLHDALPICIARAECARPDPQVRQHHLEQSLDRRPAIGLMEMVVEGLHCSRIIRSEEHTSELQSPYDLVCRLLLEKKNI